MTDRNLTVADVRTDAIDGLDVEDSAIDWLLGEFGIAPKVVEQKVVTSAKPGGETRAYVVEVHEAPDADDGMQRLYACSCPDYAYNRLPDPDEAVNPPVALSNIEPCKHGKAVRVADRSVEDRDDQQGGLGGFEA